MKIDDAITGALLTALAAFIFVYGYNLPPMRGQPYGAGAFPIAISLGLGAFSVVLMFRAWRARSAATPWIELAPWARSPDRLIDVATTLMLVLAYVALAERVGFIPMSAAILLILFLRRRVPRLRAAAIAVAATLVIHVAFASLLRVPLPRGVLDWLG